jgi:hypothetical protein
MSTPLSRRTLLARAAGGVLLLPSARAALAYAANARLRLAVFGNRYNASHFLVAAHTDDTEIVALCNPDQRTIPAIRKTWGEQAGKLEQASGEGARQAAARYRRWAAGEEVKVFADIRRLVGTMADGFDALVVSDYDHFHGVACGAALRAGKPVCTERPLGLAIEDARGLRALAAETRLPVTYRSPGTGTNRFRRAMELAEDGAIGAIREAHVWFKRGGPDADAAPKGSQPVPEGLDWDLWLGPLAWRAYHADWMSYAHWRETCSGGLGTFGPHATIFPFMALGLRALWDDPAARIRVTAGCARLNRVSFPRWERVCWELPARGSRPPVTLTWHHGPDYAPGTRERIHALLRPLGVGTAEAADALMKTAGSMLVGTDGALVGNDHSTEIVALPASRLGKEAGATPARIPESKGIYRDWLDACRGERPHILAGFENGGPLSELLMLGNIATLFPGETLVYAPSPGTLEGPAGADRQLGMAYREGWSR